jgi:muramoyltetrapeptide carboxypeptidase
MQSVKIKGVKDRWVSIVAPSTLIREELLEEGLARFARWGFPVITDDLLKNQFRYFAGKDEDRATAVIRAIRNKGVGSLWCARGGYGSTRILSILDSQKAPQQMKKDPKLLLGFSDSTGLQLYFHHHLGLPYIHCQMPATPSWQRMSPTAHKILQKILSGKMEIGPRSHTAKWKTKPLERISKSSKGKLIGGNLTLLVNMIGTPWQPNLKGCILFIEDCGELPYRVDRMLTQLENAGMLKGLKGVLIGDFEADVKYREPAERKYWKEIFQERFCDRGYPVIEKLPCGHGKQNEPLPLGIKAEITKSGKLLLLEKPTL